MTDGLKLVKKIRDLTQMIATAEAGIKALDYIAAHGDGSEALLTKLEEKYSIHYEMLAIYDKLLSQHQQELVTETERLANDKR